MEQLIANGGKVDGWLATDKTPNDYWFGGRVSRPFPRRTYEIFAEGRHANMELAELDRQYRELPWPSPPPQFLTANQLPLRPKIG